MTLDVIGALPAGTVLHEYRIDSVLGHGGFGITYLAVDTNLQKKVAIKEYLPAELSARDANGDVTLRSSDLRESFDWGRENFLKEARVLARFHNPNLIQIHRFFEANETAYFVMEYAEGSTLANELRQAGTLPEKRLLAILMPILDGLQLVHEAGILHRDIKPDNIILRNDGAPVLIDFGAAKQNLGSMTRSVMSVLTAGYAPLEQYATDGDQGPWTDLYALGALAYRAISGKKPIEPINRISNDPLMPAALVGLDRYSPTLLGAIDWALEVRPEDRPRSIKDWLDSLEGRRPVRKAPVAKAVIGVEERRRSALDKGVTEILPRSSRDDDATVQYAALQSAPKTAASATDDTVSTRWWIAPVVATVGLLLAGLWYWQSRTAPTEALLQSETTPPTVVAKPKPVEKVEAVSQPDPAAPAPTPKATAKPKPVAPKRIAVSAQKPGATFKDCDLCPEMVVLAGGRFLMGAAKGEGAGWEQPQHAVTVSGSVAFGRFEVTNRQWDACVAARACRATKPVPVSGATANAPAAHLDWNDAQTYIGWLSKETGRSYRLPTEAEWEFALRAGTNSSRFWGEDRRNQCIYANGADQSALKVDSELRVVECDDKVPALAEVGRFQPNAYGLYDMAGNVWEWTQDCWQNSYKSAPSNGSAVQTPGCDRRVMRGGSWRSRAESMRSANRGWSPEDQRSDELGLRVVAD